MEYKLHPYYVKEVIEESSIAIPWNILAVNAPSFWPWAQGVSPVGAVIDTGIDSHHPEFAGRIYRGKSFSGSSLTDTEGHGTHVAGIAVGATLGMMPWARVMPLKIGFKSSQTIIQIWDAFLTIMDHNKTCRDEDKVVAVNCSFDGPPDAMMAYYIRTLVNSGVSVVAAAGNRGDGDANTEEPFSYPGFMYEVITTGALKRDHTPSGFSSSYDGIDLSAPGEDIVSAAPGGGKIAMSGTSMAAPHVFGAILLIKAAYRKKHGHWPTTEETEKILWQCIKPLPSDSKLVGAGLLWLPGQIVTTKKMQADVEPFIKNNRTQVSLRLLGEALGARVDGSSLPTVKVELGSKTVRLNINKKEYTVESKLL